MIQVGPHYIHRWVITEIAYMDSIIPGREFQNKNSQKQKNRNCFLPDKVQLLYWVLDSQFLGNVCNAVLSVPVGYFTRLPDQRCVVQLTTRNFLKEDTNLLYINPLL